MQIMLIPPDDSEMEAARRLLAEAGLPSEDIAEPGVALWGIFNAGALVAVVGLQRAGYHGLLRSLAVARSWRSSGLARRLCDFASARAREAGIGALYLLTEDAAEYFRLLGFEETGRAAAPADIAATRQFSSLCPAEAVLMRKRL